jgi:hypothetical protein
MLSVIYFIFGYFGVFVDVSGVFRRWFVLPCYATVQGVFLLFVAGFCALDVDFFLFVIRNLNYITFHSKRNSELNSSVSVQKLY